MSKRFSAKIQELIAMGICSDDISKKFTSSLESENFTRYNDTKTHYCVYFAGYDPQEEKIFIGHHKKSNYWLFNGGHVDKGETHEETLIREIEEEWGIDFKPQCFPKPSLLTITEIDNKRVPCQKHYDIWYFIPLDSGKFNPDRKKLATEFYETGWKTFDEARKLVVDRNTLLAINKITEIIDNN